VEGHLFNLSERLLHESSVNISSSVIPLSYLNHKRVDWLVDWLNTIIGHRTWDLVELSMQKPPSHKGHEITRCARNFLIHRDLSLDFSPRYRMISKSVSWLAFRCQGRCARRPGFCAAHYQLRICHVAIADWFTSSAIKMDRSVDLHTS
jgi:hypothetical protein